MIPTDAPCSAAASAARWPARPAPITRTSCFGMRRWPVYSRGQGPAQCPLDRVDRHDSAEHALPVDGHHGTEPAEALVGQERLQRILETRAQGSAAVVAGHHGRDRPPGTGGLEDAAD